MLAAYGSALVCVYATYRIGLERGWRWGVAHLMVLVGFVVLFYCLESYAAAHTPFFYYPKPPDGFPDWIPFLPFPHKASNQPCLVPGPENCGIPFSVVLLEATLVFAAAHTARLLADSQKLRIRLLRPFMVALALLAFDFFLDPMGSASRDCTTGTGLWPGSEWTKGLGFWRWSVHGTLGPDAFGIPHFNYVLWFCAPVIMVALVLWIGWFFDFFLVPLVNVGAMLKPNILLEGAFLTLILWAFSVIYAMSPDFAMLPIWLLRLIFIAILLGSFAAILYSARDFNYRNRFRWWFVFPQAVFLLFCLLALLFSGVLTAIPSLWMVVIVVSPLFVIWMLLPYWKTIFP
jgi:hypothetical protein